MSEAKNNKPDAANTATTTTTAGRITDADIERARAQIGIARPPRSPRHEPVPSENGISHFAFSYGDDNPLWHDAEVARSTRWRGQIAPPGFLDSCGVDETPAPAPDIKKLFAGLFRGVGEYHSGTRWEYFRPVSAGSAVFFNRVVSGVDVREASKFAGGRSVHMSYQQLYVDRFGYPLGVDEKLFISAERGGSKKAGKHADITPASYSDEDIATIDSIYAAETMRGATPRWWEDVTVGATIQPLAKGPLLITDIMADHLGRGMGHYGHGPLRYGWKLRQRMPNFYTKNSAGIPDVVQRLHWEAEWAGQLGLPIPYDYGFMRTLWMGHAVTNWMGDDAWLWKFQDQLRGFNFFGDWHLIEGTVIDKRIDQGVDGAHCVAELDITGTNQRGTQTCRATVTVILPSREHGPVILPTPPQHLLRRGAQMVSLPAEQRRPRQR